MSLSWNSKSNNRNTAHSFSNRFSILSSRLSNWSPRTWTWLSHNCWNQWDSKFKMRSLACNTSWSRRHCRSSQAAPYNLIRLWRSWARALCRSLHAIVRSSFRIWNAWFRPRQMRCAQRLNLKWTARSKFLARTAVWEMSWRGWLRMVISLSYWRCKKCINQFCSRLYKHQIKIVRN